MTFTKLEKNWIRMYFFSFVFTGREPTTWPANNCPQIMVWPCVVPSTWMDFVKNNILFMRNYNHAVRWKMASRFPELSELDWLIYENKFVDRMNSVLAKYHDLWLPRRSIICLSLRLRLIIYLLFTNKSPYFAQSRPI